MFWVFVFLGIILAICAAIIATPTDVLGGIILFVLCVLGICSGVWFFVIPSVLLMIGLMMNIFGD